MPGSCQLWGGWRVSAASSFRRLRRWYREIIFGSNSMPTDRDWSQRLLGVIPNAVPGVLLGVSAPVARREEKRDLFIKTGAVAVDMESHIVAAVGLAHGLPVATIRVITDPAQRTLPRSAATAMRPDGTINIGAIVWSVLKSPSEISGLVLTAVDACAARASLVRGRYWLGLLRSSPRAAFAGFEVPIGLGRKSASTTVLPRHRRTIWAFGVPPSLKR